MSSPKFGTLRHREFMSLAWRRGRHAVGERSSVRRPQASSQNRATQVARVIRMFNPTQIVIEAFVSELKLTYERTYGLLEPSYPGVIEFVARLSLENIAGSDAAYHDINHTIIATLVGQDIMSGQPLNDCGVPPYE